MSAKKKNGTRHSKVRNEEERRAEVFTLKEKLSSLGLTEEFQEIANVVKTMNEFVSKGVSATESHKLPGLKRILHLQLCNRLSSPCSVSLTYDHHV